MTKTKVLSVHWFRRSARARERELQAELNGQLGTGLDDLPWARGVRVEKAGPFQWAVVATSDRGR